MIVGRKNDANVYKIGGATTKINTQVYFPTPFILQPLTQLRWELGCRRLTPGRPYLDAVQEKNVEIVTEGIESICNKGIRTKDGRLHEVDAIVCATGFHTSFTPSFQLRGLGGEDLGKKWASKPAEAYMGLAVAKYPNYWSKL
jgi:cation diffusion facilitator CzcD-associated flavoprotein CzcO